MSVGVQFTGTVAANATGRWFTHSWNPSWHVEWNVVSTSPNPGAAQIAWTVEVQRASPTTITYWIAVQNMTNTPVNIEARYAILN